MRHLIILACASLALVACEKNKPAPAAPEPRAPQQTAFPELRNRTVPVAAYLEEPQHFFGVVTAVDGVVAEVISARAFWLEAGPHRVLTVVQEDATPERKTIVAGQRLRLYAMPMPTAQMDVLTGSIDATTQSALDSTEGFLVTYWDEIDIAPATH